MLEKAIKGSRKYWIWLCFLALVIGAGVLQYLEQFNVGLSITGMSRDVSWGFYIAQLTFFVGVAAGGVMVVLPYYLHNYKKFGKITILGEFLAIPSLIMCLLFVFVDVGQPTRLLNVWLHPTPGSVLFWDTIVINGYMLLNLIVGWKVLEAERNGVHVASWVKPLIYISIPFAISIHTVTAFLYCGLPSRGYWLTAILAPRFLASAFAAGPAFLILLCFWVRKISKFDPGAEAIQTLSKIVCYALIINIFFFFCEAFVVFYSNIPEHTAHFKYLFFGSHGAHSLVIWMRTSIVLMIVAATMLVIPSIRKKEKWLAFACVLTFAGTWIDKGLGMISGGFVPSPLHHYYEYAPTAKELLISVGIFAIGLLILTILYKIAISVKEEVKA